MATQTKNIPKDEDSISICDVMKGNTSKIIRKMESQIPSHVQLYSDYYSEYLHSLDDIFGTCYLAEKQYFDNLNIDKNVLKAYAQWVDSFTQNVSINIDMSTKLLSSYIQMRISGIRTYDTYLHNLMDSYAKWLSLFNKQSK